MECFAKYYEKIMIEGGTATYIINNIFNVKGDATARASFIKEFALHLVSLNLGMEAHNLFSIVFYAMNYDNNHFIASASDDFYFYYPFEVPLSIKN